jgi:hypothetical protein
MFSGTVSRNQSYLPAVTQGAWLGPFFSPGSLLFDRLQGIIDNALTRHRTVDRNPNPRPEWPEISCPENNAQIFIGMESYFLSADGF